MSDGMPRWQAGDPVLLRYVRNSPADVILPVRIVHDTPDVVALYAAVGTPIKVQAKRDGTRLTRETPFVEREGMIGGLADATWTTNHVLMLHQKLHEPDRMSAIWLFWRDLEWTFRGYYANLQAPLRRTPLGFDTADYLRDVEIRPDFSWAWKDEDEWDAALDLGLVAREVLIAAREEGERVIRDIAARAWPFDAGFETWRPDPAWSIPAMPERWADGLVFPE
ncbi:MAG: hypothetical protein AVDCRST_MAG87-966 [uncultured Thermomicrobiales bacterium]|uniref:DUF402 domain-containing protein n=1 Tax=uncultured Thermomicrobiales bacterium TaxID=1645740 RepID=A0A6J4UL78_9BACT|nr:MAG: hypothetical protein AVDCRST_MAG87-966 [uncultured Thermomicrobiales bacterium]